MRTDVKSTDVRIVRAAIILVSALVVVFGGAAPSLADDGDAPQTTTSADGRTVSGEGKSLSVSQATDLDPNGQSVTVSGAGYDESKGVYVSLCVVPPPGTTPSPCGGGVDRENTSGASAWISSDPPSYASGVSQPYEPGGAFTVSLDISPTINESLDCRQVRCAIVTRNDHTRGSDRSQDLLIPVTFAEASTPTTATTSPPAVPSTTAPTTTVPPTAFAPAAELSADGRTVDDGTRTVAVSAVADLDPAGVEVRVDGSGFDPSAGIYVALCRVPAANAVPSPCATGASSSAWFSSDPPDYGEGLAVPFDDGGVFSATLTLAAVIDDSTDCRVDPCAVTVRRDDTAADDRTSDLFVPVMFLADSPVTTSAPPTTIAEPVESASAAATTDDDGAVGPIAAVAAVALVGAASGTWFVRRRVRA